MNTRPNPTATTAAAPSLQQASGDFASVLIKHEHQVAALEKLKFLMCHGQGYELLCLIGPTGVGKSTLKVRLYQDILSMERQAMEEDPSYVPIICTEAVASGFRQFDWKTLYVDALEAVGDPFARAKLRETPIAREDQRKAAGESITAADKRMRLVEELRLRRTKYWLIDEADLILKGARRGGLSDQYDVLKSIAQSAGVKLVLVGTYELLGHLQVSAQLARRTEMVHFGRYALEDKSSFASCVHALLQRSGAEVVPDVIANFDFFYSGAAGCIGILKDWTARAASQAQMDGRRDLQIDDFRKTRLTGLAIQRIIEDIRAGEELTAPDSDARIEAMVMGGGNLLSSAPVQAPKKPARRGPVGVRLPARDPVPAVPGGPTGGAHA